MVSVIGEDERCLFLFQQLYNANPDEFQVGSISNLLFMALGSEQPSQPFIYTLVKHFERLAESSISNLSADPPLVPQRLKFTKGH